MIFFDTVDSQNFILSQIIFGFNTRLIIIRAINETSFFD